MNTTLALTGVQKAAALLLQLGKDRAARVLSTMTESEVEELAAEIVRLGSVPGHVAESVVIEFHTMMRAGGMMGARGGIDAARELLEGTLGRARASSIMERVAVTPGKMPFSFLRDAEGRQLQNFLVGEHPQTIALVVAHLRSDQSAAVMAGLEPKLQAEVAQRIAQMDRTSPEMIRMVAEVLHRRTSSVLKPVETAAVGGIAPLVEIINRADPGTEKSILEGLAERDAALAELIRAQMFVFDDILTLDDRAIQLILRQVESGSLAKALKGAREEVTAKILQNVSERARVGILEEIELMGRVRASEVEEARGAVVSVIRSLEASGEIVLRSGDEDEFIN